jgi:chloride channel 7
MFCKDGEFNAVAAIWFQTPEASVRALFHDQPGKVLEILYLKNVRSELKIYFGHLGTHNPFSVGLFFVFYFILSCWTYGLSISSGIFIPALLSGAAWGRLVGLGLYNVSGKSVSLYFLYIRRYQY